MVSRTATATTPCAVEWCPWFGNLAALPHCPWCRKHHPLDYKHPGDCTVKGCRGRAVVYQGKAGLHCREHSVEDGDRIEPRNRDGRFLAASQELADLMPQAEPLPQYPTPQRDDGAAYYVPVSDKSETVHRVDWLAGHAWCTCLGFLKNRHCRHADIEEEKHR